MPELNNHKLSTCLMKYMYSDSTLCKFEYIYNLSHYIFLFINKHKFKIYIYIRVCVCKI